MTKSNIETRLIDSLYELAGGADDYGHCMVDIDKAIPIIQQAIDQAVNEALAKTSTPQTKKSKKTKKIYDIDSWFPGLTDSLNRLTIRKK